VPTSKVTQLELGKIRSRRSNRCCKGYRNYPYVDKARIGIFGWSYGGFMASNCILKGTTCLNGYAVAPVTNWRFYDSIYTGGICKHRKKKSGYDEIHQLIM
jgi:dipeptidyl-peptidase-4